MKVQRLSVLCEMSAVIKDAFVTFGHNSEAFSKWEILRISIPAVGDRRLRDLY